MFTETELRDALQHSAARVDDLHLDPPVTVAPEPRGPRRRWALPVIAAATVAAFAFGVVAVVGAPDDDRDAAVPSSPPTVHLVDRAVAGDSSVRTEYRFADVGERVTGGQTISRDLGSEKETVVLTVLPADFTSAAAIERGEKVAIAGTRGWFARRTTYLLDGEAGGKDKPLPFWTIAFRTPDGDWAFARIDGLRSSAKHDGTYDEVSVKDAARIVAAYDGLDIEWVRDAARQPMRLTVPQDVRLDGASLTVAGGRVVEETLGFRGPSSAFEVAYRTTTRATCNLHDGSRNVSRRCTFAERPIGDHGQVSLESGTGRGGLSRNKTAAILSSVTVTTDPADYVGFEQAVSR